jgi:glycerol-3-phosphate dehydrogenase (NAD(P)+)
VSRPASTSAASPRVGVLGGGGFGRALALAAARAGARVVLHSRRPNEAPSGVEVTSELAKLAEARLLVVAVPSSVLRLTARELGPHLDGSHLVVHGVRGLEGDDLHTMSDLVRAETPARRVGALAGPVQVEELLAAKPSAIVCASPFDEVPAAFAEAFESPTLRVFASRDLRGVEWAAALVGCIAVGVGYLEAAGVGPGLVAALVSRAVEEASALAAAAGADERTLFGLSGTGDLLASLAQEGRPEVRLGAALGRGRSLAEARLEAVHRVEAVELLPHLRAFASRTGVRSPLFATLAELPEGLRPEHALARFFAR